MNPKLAEFIQDNIQLIEEEYFNQLYNKASKDIPFLVGDLTSVLLQVSINPLLGVNKIFHDMFWGLDINDMIIPNGVSEIQSRGFTHCKTLGRVVLPETISYIHHSAFRGCTSLRSVQYRGKVDMFKKNFSRDNVKAIFKDCPITIIECDDGGVQL